MTRTDADIRADLGVVRCVADGAASTAAERAVEEVSDAILADRRLRGYGTEDGLQQQVTLALRRWRPDREVVVASGCRIDVLVRPLMVGVEVKVAGAAPAVERQLARYAESPLIAGLVLVTTRFGHRDVPASLSGKPVRVVWLDPL